MHSTLLFLLIALLAHTQANTAPVEGNLVSSGVHPWAFMLAFLNTPVSSICVTCCAACPSGTCRAWAGQDNLTLDLNTVNSPNRLKCSTLFSYETDLLVSTPSITVKNSGADASVDYVVPVTTVDPTYGLSIRPQCAPGVSADVNVGLTFRCGGYDDTTWYFVWRCGGASPSIACASTIASLPASPPPQDHFGHSDAPQTRVSGAILTAIGLMLLAI